MEEQRNRDETAGMKWLSEKASALQYPVDLEDALAIFVGGRESCRETEVKELQEKLDLLKNCAQQYGESVEIIEEQLRVAVEGLKENSDFHHCGLGCKPGCKWHSCIALQKIEAMKGGQ